MKVIVIYWLGWINDRLPGHSLSLFSSSLQGYSMNKKLSDRSRPTCNETIGEGYNDFFLTSSENSFFLLKPVLVEIFFLKNNFIFELIILCHKMNKIVHYNENCLCLMSVEFTHMSVWSCHTVRINRFWTCFNCIVRNMQSPCYLCMSLRSSRDKWASTRCFFIVNILVVR